MKTQDRYLKFVQWSEQDQLYVGFEVPHQDFIAVGKNVVVVLDQYDHSYKIDALHIVSVEDLITRKRKS